MSEETEPLGGAPLLPSPPPPSPYPPAQPGRRHIDSFRDLLPPFRAFVHGGDDDGAAPAAEGSGAASPDDATTPPLWGVEPDGLGISLSGGGIRSASYCLGVLQAMAANGMLFGPPAEQPNRAKYLSAVSGGSYIATALTTVASGSVATGDPSIEWKSAPPKPPQPKPPQPGTPAPGTPAPGTPAPDLSPLAPGSPEEQRLRNRALYLTHGRGGVPAAIWRLFLGIVLNLAFVAATLATLGLPLGWLYQLAWPSLRTGCTLACEKTETFAIPHYLWVALLGCAALSLVFGLWWLLQRSGGNRQAAVGAGTGAFLISALALLIFWVAIPALLHILSFQPVTAAPTAHPSPDASTQQATAKVVVGLGATSLAALLATWLAAAKHVLATPILVAGRVVSFFQSHRKVAIKIVSTAAGPLLVLIAIIGLAWVGARYPIGWSSTQQRIALIGWGLSIVAVLYAFWRMDVTTWSLHPYYRRRLSSAFVLGRIRRPAGAAPSATARGDVDVDERPYAISYDLSKFTSPNLPEVLICAAANVSDYGETPTGMNVTSFVFSPTLIGGPLVGAVPTADYEASLKKGRHRPTAFATLPTAMALSSAAITPSLGRSSLAPDRLLMALANLRLGAWVPNPRRLEKFSRSRLEPRPGPQYFVREMLGRNHLDAAFLYITDGGHYENLGLVELLRRKCKTIWCVDAAGDAIGDFSTFGGALATAKAELGVSVEINPESMAPSKSAHYVTVPYAKGKITYADGTSGSLVIVKAGVPEDAPWAVRSYHNSHPTFPCDPTLDQLYNADRFEAYRALGHFAATAALERYGPHQDRS